MPEYSKSRKRGGYKKKGGRFLTRSFSGSSHRGEGCKKRKSYISKNKNRRRQGESEVEKGKKSFRVGKDDLSEERGVRPLRRLGTRKRDTQTCSKRSAS